MYDRQPYKKDPDLCSADKIKLVSGNVIKYYTFQYNTAQPYLVNTQDDAVKDRLEKMKAEKIQYELSLEEAAIAHEEGMETEENLDAEATVSN